MEHLQRRKIFNRALYAVALFLAVAILAIAGFYNGIVFGLQLNQFAWGFVGIEILIIGFIIKTVLDEESAAKHAQKTQ